MGTKNKYKKHASLCVQKEEYCLKFKFIIWSIFSVPKNFINTIICHN